MSTTLYLANTTQSGMVDDTVTPSIPFYDLVAAAGTGTGFTGYAPTTNGGNVPIPFQRSSLDTTHLEWVSGRSPSGGWTLSGSITVHFWALESASTANAGLRALLYRYTPSTDTYTLIGGFNFGTELDTVISDNTWSFTPSSTSFAEDDMLWMQLYITRVGTMQGSQNCVLNYYGSNANSADSRIILTETVAFKAWTTAGDGASDGTGAATAVGRSSISSPGSSAGTSTAAAVGAGLGSMVGSSAGTCTVLATGAGNPSSGLAAGTSTATAVGYGAISAVGNAAGTSTALAVGSSALYATTAMTANSGARATAERLRPGYWVVLPVPADGWVTL